jgi:hypothetical protein
LGDVRRVLEAHFARVELSRMVTLIEDQPAFGLQSILTSANKRQAIMQWVSTFVLQTACFVCRKE